jgi:hypothetical protein
MVARFLLRGTRCPLFPWHSPMDVARTHWRKTIARKLKTFASATLIAAFLGPEFAAATSSTSFTTKDKKRCTIVDKRPVDTTVVSP